MSEPTITPFIPDFKLLRRIGSGAYGDIWLAETIDGEYCAIKIVTRKNFDDQTAFEREYNGVKNIKKLSRERPGVVAILHIGLIGEKQAFNKIKTDQKSSSNTEHDLSKLGDAYFYVMELGDDMGQKDPIDPKTYTPRNIKLDIEANGKKPLPLSYCLTVGIALAKAVHALHQKGLIHRDIKPANVIFINQKPQLADLGLVASLGQNTFAGTADYVAPEGPNLLSSDVYSLGKVLYEMFTGNDVNSFPEVDPPKNQTKKELKQWHELNNLIVKTAAIRKERRKITTAKELINQLKLIQQISQPKLRKKSQLKQKKFILFAGLVAVGLATTFIFTSPMKLLKLENEKKQAVEKTEQRTPLNPPLEPKLCYVSINITPENARIYNKKGEYLGAAASILKNVTFPQGEVHEYIIKAKNYQTLEYTLTVPKKEDHIKDLNMKFDKPPVKGSEWHDSLGIAYDYKNDQHRSNYITYMEWQQYQNQIAKRTNIATFELNVPDQDKTKIILLDKKSAENFAKWNTNKSWEEGLLSSDQQLVSQWSFEDKKPLLQSLIKETGKAPIYLTVQAIPYAYLAIDLSDEQQGTEVYLDGVFLGKITQNKITSWNKIPPGKKTLTLRLAGHQDHTQTIVLKENRTLELFDIKLEKNNSLIFGEKWTNQLGMKFVPINSNLMASIWETRVSDYQEYIKANKLNMPNPRQNSQQDKPIVWVSLKDAQNFAKWLTQRDRKSGLLRENQSYEVPTDSEWSLLVNVVEREGRSIPARASDHQNLFPWQGHWRFNGDKMVPLTKNAQPIGNFCDISRKNRNQGLSERQYFTAYNDQYSETAPVGKFIPNSFGIFDLAGNVAEWVSDPPTLGSNRHVARGSTFQHFLKKQLNVSWRYFAPYEKKHEAIGFRLVIRQSSPVLTLNEQN